MEKNWHPIRILDLLIALISSVLINFVNLGNPSQLSAYDDDWDDLSAFRQDLVDMGIETRSLVSSPLYSKNLKTLQIPHL